MADAKERNCNICYCIYCRKTLPQRYFLTFMLILCMTIWYIHRVCLSIAIINMTNWVEPSTSDTVVCPRSSKAEAEKLVITDEQFSWDESVQSYILFSFFPGYMIANFFIGYFMDLLGSRWCMFIGGVMTGLSTLVIPLFAYYTHWGFVCAARVIAGLAQAPLYACSSRFISRWFPDEAKSGVATTVFTSFSLGIIIGNIGSGYIMQWTKMWCWVFYIFGGIGLLWSLLFFFYIYDDPTEHPHITEKEKTLLEGIPKASKKKTPYFVIMRDLTAWIFYIGYFGNDYTLYLIITNMPKYFVQVLGFNTTQTGVILIAPPLAGTVGGLVFGVIGDLVISRKLLKKVTYRLICTTIGIPISSACLLVQVFCGCNEILSSVMVTLAMFCKAAFYGGVGMLAVDVSLNYSGFMFGMCNVVAGSSGIIAPYLIGAIAYQNTLEQWRIVQMITLLVSIVCFTPAMLFYKTTRRSWDYSEDEQKPEPDDAPACKQIWSCYKPT